MYLSRFQAIGLCSQNEVRLFSGTSKTIHRTLTYLKLHLTAGTETAVSRSLKTHVFTGEEKKQCVARLKKITMQPHLSLPPKELKNAAVLIPLCIVNGEMSLLYTLRRRDLKRHRGQVSFPGGIQDSDDSCLETTAVRETEEELGISRLTVDVWGHGNIIIGTEFNILPVIGYVGDIKVERLKPNPSEVEFAFTLPLDHFYNSQNCGYTQFRDGVGYVLPVYINGRCKIWGITALITHTVLRALSPNKYKHVIPYTKPLGF